MMTGINAITLVVDEPSTLARRLADAFGWEVTQDYGPFAEVVAGSGPLIWLNVPSDLTDQVQRGVLVHCQVDDVPAAAERARAAGATILLEPTRTDFGTESAWAQVEGGPIVDLSRPL
jgi:predicted enzyme related to lactoylglutathione lyase